MDNSNNRRVSLSSLEVGQYFLDNSFYSPRCLKIRHCEDYFNKNYLESHKNADVSADICSILNLDDNEIYLMYGDRLVHPVDVVKHLEYKIDTLDTIAIGQSFIFKFNSPNEIIDGRYYGIEDVFVKIAPFEKGKKTMNCLFLENGEYYSIYPETEVIKVDRKYGFKDIKHR